jgi:DnaJ-domain-containing protein 1
MAMNDRDLGRSIARLAVAVMLADGRMTTAEVAALGGLDALGLGPLGTVAREEIERAVREPIDVRATCAALPRLDGNAAALLLDALAQVAASDRLLAPRERDVFETIARHLGVGPAGAAHVLARAVAGASEGERDAAGPHPDAPAADPALRGALRVLGLEPGAGRARIEAAFLDLVQRYDPAKVADLGPEFAALAVRRLAKIADAYETALAALLRGPSDEDAPA